MSTCTITIANNGLRFEAPCDEIILDAALAQKIGLPHQCRGASCGTCKAQVLEGSVDHGWSLGFALSDDEKEQGFCLMCQARPASQTLSLQTVNPMPDEASAVPVYQVEATVVALRDETPSVRHVTLQIPESAEFKYPAGTYAELHFDGISPDRVYSFASPCSPGSLIDFYVALRHDGKASGYIHKHLKLGDRVGVKGPFGACRLPAGDGPVLCVAGGTGLAPILAILRQAFREGLKVPVHLLLAVRDDSEVFAWDHLLALRSQHDNFTFDLLTDVAGRLARFHSPAATLLPSLYPDLSQHRVILSGSPGFVDACQASASALGASAERTSSDRFAPTSER